MPQQKDYANLTPDRILDAIESVGIVPDCSLLALNSYENRVYRFADQDEERFVIKIYRPERWSEQQILEEHDFTLALAAEEIPVVPPLVRDGNTLFWHEGYCFALFPNRGGRILDLEQTDQLQWLGRFMARIHNVGALKPFSHRGQLTTTTFGHSNLACLQACEQLPDALREPYLTIVEQVLSLCEQQAAALNNCSTLRLHGDCHQGNVLWTDAGPHFVDFDDSIMGPAVQDLWMLVCGEGEQKLKQWDALIEGYNEFREFNVSELNIIETLRALRMINYTAWLAKRWIDPAFQVNFPWFDGGQYWENQILLLKEQYALIQENENLSQYF